MKIIEGNEPENLFTGKNFCYENTSLGQALWAAVLVSLFLLFLLFAYNSMVVY